MFNLIDENGKYLIVEGATKDAALQSACNMFETQCLDDGCTDHSRIYTVIEETDAGVEITHSDYIVRFDGRYEEPETTYTVYVQPNGWVIPSVVRV